MRTGTEADLIVVTEATSSNRPLPTPSTPERIGSARRAPSATVYL
jgi:hypothetical protein